MKLLNIVNNKEAEFFEQVAIQTGTGSTGAVKPTQTTPQAGMQAQQSTPQDKAKLKKAKQDQIKAKQQELNALKQELGSIK